MGGRSSLPTPGERSDNDFSGPPSLLWSPWLELGATMSDTNAQLSMNPELISKSFQLKAVNKIKLLQQSTQNTSLLFFPLSSMKFLNSIHLNEFSLEKSEQPQLSSLSTFKRLPRSLLG